MIRPAYTLLLAALLAGACAELPAPSRVADGVRTGPSPTPFSTAVSLDGLPDGWRHQRLTRLKKPTRYRLVDLNGSVAVEAVAESSASGLQFSTTADPREYPWLSWKWQVTDIIEEADNLVAHLEDSPARVIVTFEGGREDLPPAERINYDLAKAMSGHEMPFATLMYIWENRLPVGEVITHHFSSRIKMIVAGSGRERLNVWHERRVNLLEDYRRAFGEEPPRVKAVGVMSDSDNTGQRATTYYGDIRFQKL